MGKIELAGGNPIVSQTDVFPDDYQDFFENGAVALHLIGADGTILRANQAELDLLGYAADEYIGRHISEFHIDADTISEMLARLRAGEKLVRFPARMRANDGSIKHVETTSSAQFRNGEFINTRCFTVDVTEIVDVRRQLARKDEEMRQVLEALPAAVYTTDARGKITYFNHAAAELAGREPIVGEDEWCVTFRLFTADGQPLPHKECPMAIALRENRPIRGVEAMAQRPDGSMFPFLPFPTPMRNDDGELTGAVNMLVDISDRKLAKSNQRVFLDELNHRVKNNMMMLCALLRSAERESDSREARIVLGDAAQRVGAMAAAQHALYTEHGRSEVDAKNFVNAVCDSARQAFSENVALHIDVDAGSLANDVTMPLALILNELLTNAAKHGCDEAGNCEIWISLKQLDGDFLLTVRDNGPGFNFKVTGRRSSGTGLVAGLVRQLRGSFSVAPGPGARCTVRFPGQFQPESNLDL
ncbi:sensor histidine kinase [Rhizobium leucaenae]|uniref:histidine kinase n=1 Tax=Rhizobium leucaenae TaxID=29450 RepID=A0A7W7EN71_9HYPH|nr:PAS domain S-box protein [Rhizobium leucaenae]MBB4571292.1 PAS domain S-box-containing protein [Rhizobium leucaenae]MBB6305457.1 PAS domain S-box-containing protein [Rhizobium leucaenae]